jgi:hypothetical protein
MGFPTSDYGASLKAVDIIIHTMLIPLLAMAVV